MAMRQLWSAVPKVTSTSELVESGLDIINVKTWKKGDERWRLGDKLEFEVLREFLRDCLLIASEKIERGEPIIRKMLAADLQAVCRLIKRD
jgi:hypothetical protein